MPFRRDFLEEQYFCIGPGGALSTYLVFCNNAFEAPRVRLTELN